MEDTLEAPARTDRFGSERPQPVGLDLPLGGATAEAMDEEEQKHKKRAERFGTTYVKPVKRNVLSRSEFVRDRLGDKANQGFVTGIDLFSEEEVKRREKRAEKYGNTLLGLNEDEIREAELRKKREEKFGKVEAIPDPSLTGMDIELLEERKAASTEAVPRLEGVYLYGIDLLSTRDCLAYFREYGPSYIEWINDSSCVVLFQDEFSAKRAIKGKGELMDDEAKEANAGIAADDAWLLWHKGPDFVKDKVNIPLVFRAATWDDVKSGKTQSRYLWLKNGPSKPRPQHHQPARKPEKRKRERDDAEMAEAPELPDDDLRKGVLKKKDLRARIDAGSVPDFQEDDEQLPEAAEAGGEAAMEGAEAEAPAAAEPAPRPQGAPSAKKRRATPSVLAEVQKIIDDRAALPAGPTPTAGPDLRSRLAQQAGDQGEDLRSRLTHREDLRSHIGNVTSFDKDEEEEMEEGAEVPVRRQISSVAQVVDRLDDDGDE